MLSSEALDEVRPRPGRPRSDACELAIMSAALELLVEDGFAGMSIERVASRAGVGKASIYRRWDTKADLVVDAVLRHSGPHPVIPDGGNLRDDLLEMLTGLLHKFRNEGKIMEAFAAERGRHPELAEVFRTTFVNERRAVMQRILAAAVERGELPADTDLELLGDVGAAVMWHRLAVSGAPLADDLPERIVRQFFPTLTAD